MNEIPESPKVQNTAALGRFCRGRQDNGLPVLLLQKQRVGSQQNIVSNLCNERHMKRTNGSFECGTEGQMPRGFVNKGRKEAHLPPKSRGNR